MESIWKRNSIHATSCSHDTLPFVIDKTMWAMYWAGLVWARIYLMNRISSKHWSLEPIYKIFACSINLIFIQYNLSICIGEDTVMDWWWYHYQPLIRIPSWFSSSFFIGKSKVLKKKKIYIYIYIYIPSLVNFCLLIKSLGLNSKIKIYQK